MDQLYYVYAVVRLYPGAAAALPAAGILPGCSVELVADGDLAAVVSAVPDDEFAAATLDQRLENLEWVQARALAHQQTLAALLNRFTVAPVSFCTLFRGQERIRAMLAEHHTTFDTTLARLEHTAEWGVKIFCDRQVLIGWAARESEPLAPQRLALETATQGAAFFLRKKLIKSAEQQADQLIDTMLQAVQSQLADAAREEALGKIHSQQARQTDNELILNAAYLVADDELAKFRDRLSMLATTFGSRGLHFELSGPWPAYHFVAGSQ